MRKFGRARTVALAGVLLGGLLGVVTLQAAPGSADGGSCVSVTVFNDGNPWGVVPNDCPTAPPHTCVTVDHIGAWGVDADVCEN